MTIGELRKAIEGKSDDTLVQIGTNFVINFAEPVKLDEPPAAPAPEPVAA